MRKRTASLIILMAALIQVMIMINITYSLDDTMILGSSKLTSYMNGRLQYNALTGFSVFSIVPSLDMPVDRGVYALYMIGNDTSTTYERLLISAIAINGTTRYFMIKIDAGGEGQILPFEIYVKNIVTPVVQITPDGKLLYRGREVLTN